MHRLVNNSDLGECECVLVDGFHKNNDILPQPSLNALDLKSFSLWLKFFFPTLKSCHLVLFNDSQTGKRL